MALKCCNCPKPAVYLVGPKGQQLPLCLDCNLKHAQLMALQNAELETQINYLSAHAEAVTGLPGLLPRFPQRRAMILQGGNMALTNIRVSNSNIGVLNTGNLEVIDSAITLLGSQPETQGIAGAIKRLTDAIASAPELSPEKKNEALEMVGFLASEATAPPERRRSSVAKRLLFHLPTVIQTAASALQIWEKLSPVVAGFFQ